MNCTSYSILMSSRIYPACNFLFHLILAEKIGEYNAKND